MTKRPSRHGLCWSPYLTFDICLCYVIIVCVCYVFVYLCTCYLCYVLCVLCVVASLSYVRAFSLCYVPFAVTNLVASLRACVATLAWLASLAAGVSRPHSPLRDEKTHAVTAAVRHLTFSLRSYIHLYGYVYIWQNYCEVRLGRNFLTR